MDNATARVLGGTYIAICRALKEALGEEAADPAHNVLFGFAENPDHLRPEDRRIYRLIAEAASRDPEELRAENEELEAIAELPQLRGIAGGEA